jgi:hypothetical protein
MADEESKAQAAEAAAVRQRWLTLGEILAVAAVLISALTLWNSYSERSHSEADKVRDASAADSRAKTLVLKATAEKDGDRLEIHALGDQAIQGQTIRFPSALGLDPVDSTDPRIETSWFESGLKKVLADRDKKESAGDKRLPIAITTRFYADDKLIERSALYDIGYVTEGHFLGGTSIRLRGLSLIGQTDDKGAAARVDALWKARHPAKATEK